MKPYVSLQYSQQPATLNLHQAGWIQIFKANFNIILTSTLKYKPG
jgi:hypothetical protein